MLMFSREAKPGSTRDQDLDIRSSTEQVGDEGGGVDDVFVIVQNEQQASLAKECLKPRDQGFIGRFAQTEALSDSGCDEIGMRDWRETNEADAIREIRGKPVGDGKG